MKYNELTTETKKNNKRKGRGISAGQGKTAGRGTKGQNSRTGGRVKAGFVGGQNPLIQRLPKLRGFKSLNTHKAEVQTGQLNDFKTVDNTTLFEKGLIENPYVSVKLVAKGELKSKLAVKLQGASTGAIKAVEAAGGTFEQIERLKRQQKSK